MSNIKYLRMSWPDREDMIFDVWVNTTYAEDYIQTAKDLIHHTSLFSGVRLWKVFSQSDNERVISPFLNTLTANQIITTIPKKDNHYNASNADKYSMEGLDFMGAYNNAHQDNTIVKLVFIKNKSIIISKNLNLIDNWYDTEDMMERYGLKVLQYD